MGSVRSDSKEERDFLFADNLEPHATRRKEILKAHPEITKLMGPEWRTKYLVAATVALQITLACFAKSWSFWTFVAVAYIVGATANHSLFLAIHELAHNLGAKSASANKIIGMVANLPIVFPYCITFKPYHMAHHRNQGVEGIDTDVPTLFEGYLITKSSFGRVDHMIRKAIFMFFQIFAYALRPMFIKPDLVPLDFWVLCNFFVMAFFDYFMFVTVGWQAVVYFLLSTFFAGSIHPTAGHFIAEHYVMEGDAETYSYYGPLNRLAYNVGYHNADVPLTDFLLQRWPSFFSTSSVARRTVARGRVWMAEEVVQSGAPGAELGPLRQAWWSESIKGKTILFVPDYPRRSPHETKLVVLWEDDHLAVVVKEPGLRLFGGIRTLANMLAAKEEGASLHPSKEEDALPAPVPLHFLEAEIGGCVLVAKTARAALQGLSSPSRCFQGLFVTGGVLWDEAKLLAATGWTLRRMEPSVRFGHLLAAERGAAEHSAAALRCSAAELAAANGAPALLGDVEFGGEEAPRIRRNQLFLVVSRWHLRRACARRSQEPG